MTDKDDVAFTLRTLVKPTGSPIDLKVTALALREARRHGVYSAVLAEALYQRAQWRLWLTRTQSEWRANVSRRMARGDHPDSWGIREGYARIHNAPGEYPREQWEAADSAARTAWRVANRPYTPQASPRARAAGYAPVRSAQRLREAI